MRFFSFKDMQVLGRKIFFGLKTTFSTVVAQHTGLIANGLLVLGFGLGSTMNPSGECCCALPIGKASLTIIDSRQGEGTNRVSRSGVEGMGDLDFDIVSLRKVRPAPAKNFSCIFLE